MRPILGNTEQGQALHETEGRAAGSRATPATRRAAGSRATPARAEEMQAGDKERDFKLLLDEIQKIEKKLARLIGKELPGRAIFGPGWTG